MSDDDRSKVLTALINHPRVVTGGLVVLVGAHAAAAGATDKIPTFGENLDGKVPGVAAFYLGAAGSVAMVGGFAGIVVVFAMTQGLKRFAKLRAVGGESLETNWIHPISVSFLSAALLIAAAYSQMIGRDDQAAWLFELALLLALHGAIRLIWLLKNLIRAVRLEDIQNLTPTASDEEAIPRLTT